MEHIHIALIPWPPVNHVFSNLQSNFQSLQNLFVDLKLVVNVGKTKYVLYSWAQDTSPTDLCISIISGVQIEIPSYKYLGIWIDDWLSIKTHVDEQTN